MSDERPTCLTCGKRLSKQIHRARVPFDCEDVGQWIYDNIGPHPIHDSPATVQKRLDDARERFNDRMQQAKEAQQRMLAKHNEPKPKLSQASAHMSFMADERWAEEPKPEDYAAEIRIWKGRYGYDGRGLFHAGTCAIAWANSVAGDLRRRGKI